MPASVDRKDVRRYAEQSRPHFEDLLKTFVEIPSVSMDPAHKKDMKAMAEAAAAAIRGEGGKAEVVKTKGAPAVVGAFMTSKKNPTLTIYNHLDVQPAGGPEWKRPPFEMQKEKDCYYARGATDDKGPALTALLAARYAAEADMPLNIRFLWETEEEIGSPNFESFLKKAAPSMPTDSVVVSDTIWVSRKKPAVSAGLRGLQGATLRLTTGSKDTHSGLTGGAARNPITELCEVVANCVDAWSGHVKIPGFYDDVVPPTRQELKWFRECGFSTKEFMQAHGLKHMRHDDSLTVMRSIWSAPTFEMHGMAGGYQGPGIKTAVPPHAEAKVSMRLVPDQSPKKMFRLLRDYVKWLNPDVVVEPESSLGPYRGVTTGPYAKAAVDAIKFAYDKKPAFVREGGSIGAVVTMKNLLKCPITFIGLSLPEHGYHAPNEFFDWDQASGGMVTFVKYFDSVSRIKRR